MPRTEEMHHNISWNMDDVELLERDLAFEAMAKEEAAWEEYVQDNRSDDNPWIDEEPF